MSFIIRLENEDGEVQREMVDHTKLIENNLQFITDNLKKCVCFIDLYGDTVFNSLQIDVFLSEWERLSDKAETQEEKETISGVIELAKTLKQKSHTYLKFYGD